jgi:uncharacterized lipoprotein YajG
MKILFLVLILLFFACCSNPMELETRADSSPQIPPSMKITTPGSPDTVTVFNYRTDPLDNAPVYHPHN